MTIGERIKQKRIENGWSQRELAARMKYSHHSTLARIETGKVDVSQKRITQFAEVLDTTVAYLMGWEEEKKEKPAIMIDELKGLTDAQIKLRDFVNKEVPEEKAELALRVLRSIVEAD